jgi:hypothetical protein
MAFDSPHLAATSVTFSSAVTVPSSETDNQAILGLAPRKILNFDGGSYALFTPNSGTTTDWLRLDFGKKVWIEQVLLLAGNHCQNAADHYFYSNDLSSQPRPYPPASDKLEHVYDSFDDYYSEEIIV